MCVWDDVSLARQFINRSFINGPVTPSVPGENRVLGLGNNNESNWFKQRWV